MSQVNQIVETVVDLVVDDNHVIPTRDELCAACVVAFPEHEAVIRDYFVKVNRECKDAEVLAARLHREYLESQWN